MILVLVISIICSAYQMVYHWNANNKYTNSQNFKLLTLKSSYYVSYFGCIKERSIETKGAYLIFSLFCSRFERFICSRRNSYDVISHTKDSNRIPANKNRPVHKASHLLHPDSFIHISLGDFLALKCLFVSVEATFVLLWMRFHETPDETSTFSKLCRVMLLGWFSCKYRQSKAKFIF